MKNVLYISTLRPIILFILFSLYFNNIYAQSEYLICIKSVEIIGNSKTKPNVILRELSFKPGDSIPIGELINKVEESKTNLLNTPLFNYVDFETEQDLNYNVYLTITVEERWYLWPQFGVYYADRNISNWIKNRDFSRTDIGLGLFKYNFLGQNQKLSLFTIFGYDEELILNYENVFLDKNKKHSLSFFAKQLKRKETGCKIENDQLKQIKLSDEYALKLINVSLKYSYRKKHYNHHSFYLGYENREISDSLLICNPFYTKNSLLKSNHMFAKYVFVRDKRNNRVFPTIGDYTELTILKNGLNLFPESNINTFYIKTEFSKYSQLNKWISIGNHVTLKYKTDKHQNFFLNSAIGYDSNIRGYEFYVINGSNFFLSKNNVNFQIISERIIQFKKIPLKRFNKIHYQIFAGVFADAAYVVNNDINYTLNNKLANTWLYCYGVSLNILTYYDKLLRVDFSTNHLKESRFYLYFEAPF